MDRNDYFKFIILFMLGGILTTSVFSRQIYPDWQIACHRSETDLSVSWYKATVPGAVQLDGIWDDTYLVIRSNERLNDVFVSHVLSDDLAKAFIKVNVSGMQISEKFYQWTLKDPGGKIVIEKQGILSSDHFLFEAGLDSPSLWWPNEPKPAVHLKAEGYPEYDSVYWFVFKGKDKKKQ